MLAHRVAIRVGAGDVTDKGLLLAQGKFENLEIDLGPGRIGGGDLGGLRCGGFLGARRRRRQREGERHRGKGNFQHHLLSVRDSLGRLRSNGNLQFRDADRATAAAGKDDIDIDIDVQIGI